jgi:hypothetical protein
VANADLDRAIDGRRTLWAGGAAGLAGVLFVAAVVAVGPGLFFSLLGRVFAPFAGAGPAPTATRLTVVRPEDGDAVVPEDRSVEILVRVDGRVPDRRAAEALKLLYRYQHDAPYRERLLDPADGGRWGTTLAAVDVQEGFWYKVTGGDAETPEHRVRLVPRVDEFQATYHFRPYVGLPDDKRTERKIEAVRGTTVDVRVLTNREVKDARLDFVTSAGVRTPLFGTPLKDDPTGFVVHFTPEESGEYRIAFTSAEGESFVEPRAYPLVALPDAVPQVELTKPPERKDKPGWVAPLAADALLELEGRATDDIGVAAMRLRMRVENGPDLPQQEYRTPKDYQLPGGGNPRAVDYKDFVDLTKVHPAGDDLFALRPGMVLEYWLEAEDACDYPKPNVGESKHYKLQLAEPIKNEQAKKDAVDKAEKEKMEQEAKQQEEQRKEAKERQEKGNKGGGQGEDKPGEKGDGKKEGDQPRSNPGGEGSKGDKPDKSDQPKDGPGQKDNPDKSSSGGPGDKDKPGGTGEGQKKQDDKTKEDGKRVSDALDRKPGEGKGDPKDQRAGEGKESGQPQQAPQPGEAKKDPGGNGAKDAAHDKAAGGAGDKHDQAEGKGAGPSDAKEPTPPSEAKGAGEPKADAAPGAAKDGRSEAPPKPAEAKGSDSAGQKEPAAAKPDAGGSADKGASKAEPKDAPPQGAGGPDKAPQPAGEAKDKPAPDGHGEAKGGDEKGGEKAGAAAAKPGPQSPDADKQPKPEGKGDGGQHEKDAPRAEAKANPDDAKPNPRDATPRDVDDLAKDLKSDDPKKQEEAARQLIDAWKHADDPRTREKAEEELKKALQRLEQERLAQPKPQEPPPEERNPDAEKAPPSEAKSDSGDGPKGQAKGADPKQGGDQGQAKGDGQNGPPASGKGTPKGGPGIPSGEPRYGDFAPEPAGGKTPTLEKPADPKATELQLRHLEKADRKTLEKLGWTDEEWRKFLEDYRDLARREAAAGETLPAGKNDGSLNSTGGDRAVGKGLTDDPNNGGRAQAPPGYREPLNEFNRLISEEQRGADPGKPK